MDPGPEIEPHGHRHTGRSWLDVVLGVSAIAISLFSAVMTLGHGRAMERMVEQNARMVQASTWPYVTIADSNRDPQGRKVYELKIMNNGVGPARVKSLIFSYKGRRMEDVNALVHAIAREAEIPPFGFSASGIGGVLPARATIALLSVSEPTSSPSAIDALNRVRDKIDVHACYCSLFDDCWTVSSQYTAEPRAARSCPTNPV